VRKRTIIFVTLLALLLVVLCPFIGIIFIDPRGIARGFSSQEHQIFWELRVPRVLIAFLTGGSLALCGFVYQKIFHNILVCPYTIGVSSGAALGASLAVKLGLVGAVFGISPHVGSALMGALLVMFLVALLSRWASSGLELLLSGVVVSIFCSSIIILLQYLSDFTEIFRITRWLMGGFDSITPPTLFSLVPLIVVATLVIVRFSYEIEILALGDEIALTRGVEVQRIRLYILAATSLLVGATVSAAGPIGFVGIIIPHTARMLASCYGKKAQALCWLLGGSFLVFCDTIGRILIAPFEIPVGVITALVGSPFFVLLLLRRTNAMR